VGTRKFAWFWQIQMLLPTNVRFGKEANVRLGQAQRFKKSPMDLKAGSFTVARTALVWMSRWFSIVLRTGRSMVARAVLLWKLR
jgi:hypothetical protein